MKRDIIFLVCSIFLISTLFVTPVTVSTQNASFYYSLRSRSDNFLSGRLSDYKDAMKIEINNSNSLSIVEEVFFKNSEDFLWIALRTELNSSFDGIGILFDTDHDQTYVEDVKILFTDNSRSDGYFQGSSAFNEQELSNFDGIESHIIYIDGISYHLFEFKIPLYGNSPLYDLVITDPADYLLGFDIVSIYETTMYSEALGEISSYSSDASNFPTLILAGPGRFAVPDFEPETYATSTTLASSTATQTSTGGSSSYDGQAAAGSAGFEFGLFEFTGFILVGMFLVYRKRRVVK